METDINQDAFISQAMTNVMRTQAVRPRNGRLEDVCISVDQTTLSHCQMALAHLIHNGDDVYLPIFQRIRQELALLEKDADLKDLAMTLVAQSIQNPYSNIESLH